MRHPSSLSAILQELLHNLGLERRVAEQAAIRLWPKAVGEHIAAVTTPVRVRDGVLFVKVKSSVWRQELLFQRRHILANINKIVGDGVIRAIHFE
ncbi:MAG: DUF721 domain-containing protein [candidate division KSB1 bacterium]|nr:DUF721 domain-containing protein [candidate division KSB1 bacterium]MDZ7294304.1 DUF721 domain-containing protein [candidate division KSB1 bacterium]MDZ7339465.1 DUF721 domain-containing protein [candidate division KSB1 bacterium]MDZ7384804.1 DUF721 domain-containing protein [candidate division KSB1 bacterium]MDZ7392362.1 DUF721 domain-containing protein [candidate division KSB1 bacterium]